MENSSPAKNDSRAADAHRLGPEALGAEDLRVFEEIEAWRKGESTADDEKMKAAYHVDKELAFRDSYQPPHPTILILHASVGSGHRSAAIAIAQELCDLRDRQLPAFPDGRPLDPGTRVVVSDILAWGDHVFDGNKTATSFTGKTRPLYDLNLALHLWVGLCGDRGPSSTPSCGAGLPHIGHIKPLAVIIPHHGSQHGRRRLHDLQAELPGARLHISRQTLRAGLWPHKAADVFCVGNESMAELCAPATSPTEDPHHRHPPTRIDFRRSTAPRCASASACPPTRRSCSR